MAGGGEVMLGTVLEIRRFPVKSILGESLSSATLDERGLLGDRLWAIRNQNGKFGSGKTTRRFQHMKGLFDFKAEYDGDVPVVTMPDGTVYRGDHQRIHKALTESLGDAVTLAQEEAISHFDEGPVSIITTSSLHQVSNLLGEPVDPRRFRANFLIDTVGAGYVEDAWIGDVICLGQNVRLRVVGLLTRCVMVNNAQGDLEEDARLLRTLAREHNATFGVFAKVECGGMVSVGNTASLQNL